jgi:hypothetical protein
VRFNWRNYLPLVIGVGMAYSFFYYIGYLVTGKAFYFFLNFKDPWISLGIIGGVLATDIILYYGVAFAINYLKFGTLG